MFRRYNRKHSRFDQPDPYDGSYSLTSPQSLNRYAYVGGDPVNFVDPNGLDDVPGGPGVRPIDPATGHPFFIPAGQFGVVINIGGWEGSLGALVGGVGVSDRDVMLDIDMANFGRGPQNPLPREPKDPDTKAVNTALGACSTGASIGQYSTVNPAGTAWKGVNGQWSRIGWGGNGSTGARSAALGRAGALGLLSRATGTVGAGFSFYQSSTALRQGNSDQAARGIWDAGFGLAGAFGGPWGAAASGAWFGLSTLLDANPELATACRCDAQCRRK